MWGRVELLEEIVFELISGLSRGEIISGCTNTSMRAVLRRGRGVGD